MSKVKKIDALWDDSPVDVTQEAISFGLLQIN